VGECRGRRVRYRFGRGGWEEILNVMFLQETRFQLTLGHGRGVKSKL